MASSSGTRRFARRLSAGVGVAFATTLVWSGAAFAQSLADVTTTANRALEDVAGAVAPTATPPKVEAPAAVADAAAPVVQAAAPVVGVAGQAAASAAPVAAPVQGAVAPVVQTVVETAAPVVETATQAVAPVVGDDGALAVLTEPVVRETNRIVAPLVEPTTPVLAPVVEPASSSGARPVEASTPTLATSPVSSAAQPTAVSEFTPPGTHLAGTPDAGTAAAASTVQRATAARPVADFRPPSASRPGAAPETGFFSRPSDGAPTAAQARQPSPLEPGLPGRGTSSSSSASASPGTGGSAFVAALLAAFLLVAPGLSRLLRLGLASRPLPVMLASLERPG